VIHSDGKLQVVPSWLHGILFCGDCNILGDTPSVYSDTWHGALQRNHSLFAKYLL